MFQCLNILKYRHLILHKAWADFRAEAERTYLGVAWWVLDPLISMCIYYLVFGVFLRRRTENFVPFLIVGLVTFRFFESTVKSVGQAIFRHKNLVYRVDFLKTVFPIAVFLTHLMHYFFSMVLMFIILFLYGFHFRFYFLAFPVVLLVEMLLILALGLIACAIIPLVPDLNNVISYALKITWFMSGIFYSGTDLPEKMQRYFWLNPVAQIVHANRVCLMDKSWPDWGVLLEIAIISVVIIYFGAALICHWNGTYAKRMVS